jgi:hypothetical protein
MTCQKTFHNQGITRASLYFAIRERNKNNHNLNTATTSLHFAVPLTKPADSTTLNEMQIHNQCTTRAILYFAAKNHNTYNHN